MLKELVKKEDTQCVYDLGSGWGFLAVALAKDNPQKQVRGFELSPVPYLFSQLLVQCSGVSNLKIYKKDFLKERLDTQLLVAYLHPRGMQQVAKKLNEEKFAGVLLSSTFALDAHRADFVVQVADIYVTPIYRYSFAVT